MVENGCSSVLCTLAGVLIHLPEGCSDYCWYSSKLQLVSSEERAGRLLLSKRVFLRQTALNFPVDNDDNSAVNTYSLLEAGVLSHSVAT